MNKGRLLLVSLIYEALTWNSTSKYSDNLFADSGFDEKNLNDFSLLKLWFKYFI